LRARTPEQRALVDLETHYTKVNLHRFSEFTVSNFIYADFSCANAGIS
jgi:hypothetical protein